MVGLDVRESSNWGSLGSVWDNAFAGELEDLNITATSEGLVIDVTLDGEVQRSAWLTWADLHDLTQE